MRSGLTQRVRIEGACFKMITIDGVECSYHSVSTYDGSWKAEIYLYSASEQHIDHFRSKILDLDNVLILRDGDKGREIRVRLLGLQVDYDNDGNVTAELSVVKSGD